MNSDSFLLSFGMKPDEGFVYETWEARKNASCPGNFICENILT